MCVYFVKIDARVMQLKKITDNFLFFFFFFFSKSYHENETVLIIFLFMNFEMTIFNLSILKYDSASWRFLNLWKIKMTVFTF